MEYTITYRCNCEKPWKLFLKMKGLHTVIITVASAVPPPLPPPSLRNYHPAAFPATCILSILYLHKVISMRNEIPSGGVPRGRHGELHKYSDCRYPPPHPTPGAAGSGCHLGGEETSRGIQPGTQTGHSSCHGDVGAEDRQ